jgi:6-phosphogluconolactonase
VSGGATPWAMFRALEGEDVPWDDVGIWQVDERIAPRGDDDRSLTQLEASIPHDAALRIHPMPVDDIDPDDDDALNAAAGEYTVELPERFDLIHLGLGDDGHTASLAPGDPIVDVLDRDVAITGEYRGRRRMTLTLPVLDRAHRILWIATGASKAEALRKLRDRDASIPAARVGADEQVAIVDRAAAEDRTRR